MPIVASQTPQRMNGGSLATFPVRHDSTCAHQNTRNTARRPYAEMLYRETAPLNAGSRAGCGVTPRQQHLSNSQRCTGHPVEFEGHPGIRDDCHGV